MNTEDTYLCLRLRAADYPEAAARIEALSAKVQGYYNEASDGWTKFRDCERKLKQAEARAEALEKDAARYRWLRKRQSHGMPFEANDMRIIEFTSLSEVRSSIFRGSGELDAAIDAALASQPDGRKEAK